MFACFFNILFIFIILIRKNGIPLIIYDYFDDMILQRLYQDSIDRKYNDINRNIASFLQKYSDFNAKTIFLCPIDSYVQFKSKKNIYIILLIFRIFLRK